MQPSAGVTDVWVLLTRHQVTNRRQSEYIALHVHDQEEDRMDIKRIAAKVDRFISKPAPLIDDMAAAGDVYKQHAYFGMPFLLPCRQCR